MKKDANVNVLVRNILILGIYQSLSVLEKPCLGNLLLCSDVPVS